MKRILTTLSVLCLFAAVPVAAQNIVLDDSDFLFVAPGVDQTYELIVPSTGAATFRVKLDGMSTASDTVTVTTLDNIPFVHHTNPSAATVSPAQLIFTASNYSTYQTVRVRAVPNPGSSNTHEHLKIAVSNHNYPEGGTGSFKVISATVSYETDMTVGVYPCTGHESGNGSNSLVVVTFFLSKTVPTGSTVEVRYSTQDGTATAGSDYTAVSNQSVLFSQSQRQKKVRLAILDDDNDDSGETFNIVLSSPHNATLDRDYSTAVCTILNSEDDPGDSGGGDGTGGGGTVRGLYFRANADGVTVQMSWRELSFAKYRYQWKEGFATDPTLWTPWKDIPDSGPGGENSTSYAVAIPELESGKFYTFRFEGVYADGTAGSSSSTTLYIQESSSSNQDPGGSVPTAAQFEELPEAVTLSQNYPNPFNPSTRIDYALPEGGNVRLSVYDMHGREVAELVSGFRAAGRRELRVLSSAQIDVRAMNKSNEMESQIQALRERLPRLNTACSARLAHRHAA